MHRSVRKHYNNTIGKIGSLYMKNNQEGQFPQISYLITYDWVCQEASFGEGNLKICIRPTPQDLSEVDAFCKLILI